MKRFLITCLALCTGFLTFSQEEVDFKLNPEVGKPLQLNMLIKTDIDGPQSVIMDMNMKMELHPSKKEDENFRLENVIKAIKIDINADMNTVSYNSETVSTDETTKMLGEQFSKIVDQKISAVITDKGKTIDIDLPSSMSSNGFDPSSFTNISPSFPDKAVAPGESWNNINEMDDHPFLSKIETVSTYSEENTEGYVINVASKMLDLSGNEIGTVLGNYTLDKETHFTKTSALKTSVEIQGAKIIKEVEVTIE